MSQPLKTVAVLVANPALSSILTVTLASVPTLRVRAFESEAGLKRYLQITTTDLVVADLDSLTHPADRLAERLRADAQIPGQLQVIALARTLSADTKMSSLRAGIDEIIMKPMSPRYLVERVIARLARPAMADRRRSLRKRDWSSFGSNVVPLFGPTSDTVH